MEEMRNKGTEKWKDAGMKGQKDGGTERWRG